MEKQDVINSATAAQQTAPVAKETALQKAGRQGNLIGLKTTEISEVFASYKNLISKALPSIMTPDRLIAMATTEFSRNPKLLSCSVQSLIGSVLQAAELGFQPVSALGYCYFVPYGKDVQFQIGYKGYIDLARRSGSVKSIYAEVVREGDTFKYTLGLHRDLVHEPTGDVSKPLTHVYAVCELTNDTVQFVVLSRNEVERLRMRSPMQKAQPSGAWATDYEAMAKAKALKQLAKYLPLDTDKQGNFTNSINNALSTDEKVIRVENFDKNTGEVKVEELEYEELPPVGTENAE